MNIDHDTWLGLMLQRNFICQAKDHECDIYLSIPNTTATTVDLDDENYQIPFDQMLKMGKDNGWIAARGCPIHNPDSYNYKYSFINVIRPKSNALQQRIDRQREQDELRGFPSIAHTLEVTGENGEIFISPWETAQQLIEQALSISTPQYFIDIGSGAGVPLYIAQDYSYTHRIGIDIYEYSHPAKLNAQIIQYDAKDWIMPDVFAHVFMFNPFLNDILISFLEHNIETLARHGSLIIFENNTRAHHVFLAYGFIPIYTINDNAIYQFGPSFYKALDNSY